MYQKGCILTAVALVLFRLGQCRHLLHNGGASGELVAIQDTVLASCQGHFMCEIFPYGHSAGLTCLSAGHVCDGIQHCKDGSDELPSECGKKSGFGGEYEVVSEGDIRGGKHLGDGAGDYEIVEVVEGENGQLIRSDSKYDTNSNYYNRHGHTSHGGKKAPIRHQHKNIYASHRSRHSSQVFPAPISVFQRSSMVMQRPMMMQRPVAVLPPPQPVVAPPPAVVPGARPVIPRAGPPVPFAGPMSPLGMLGGQIPPSVLAEMMD